MLVKEISVNSRYYAATTNEQGTSMLDHVSIAVTDIVRSIAFYSRALAPLGITRLNPMAERTTSPITSVSEPDTSRTYGSGKQSRYVGISISP